MFPRKPTPPSEPSEPVKKFPMTFLPILGVLSGLYCWGNGNIWIGLLIIFITIYLYLRMKKKLQIKYNTMLSNYRQEYVHYQSSIQSYNLKLKEITSPTYIKLFRKEETYKIIKKATKTPSETNRLVEKGKFEDYFYGYLIKWFGSKIKLNTELGYFENPYIPDFAFIDTTTGLHIDIEIDEPYIAKNNEPIHYIGSDDNRNNYFIENNWVVIRFAEKQVAEYPDSCCKVIAVIINSILDDNHYISLFTVIEDLSPINCWTFEESIQMAQIKYRNNYK